MNTEGNTANLLPGAPEGNTNRLSHGAYSGRKQLDLQTREIADVLLSADHTVALVVLALGGCDGGSAGDTESGGDSESCHPSYSPCLDPTASDYDCAGGTGDGPRYVEGPVQVTGSDPFDLDADGVGVGCD